MFTEMILERFRTASLLYTSAGQVYSADLQVLHGYVT